MDRLRQGTSLTTVHGEHFADVLERLFLRRQERLQASAPSVSAGAEATPSRRSATASVAPYPVNAVAGFLRKAKRTRPGASGVAHAQAVQTNTKGILRR